MAKEFPPLFDLPPEMGRDLSRMSWRLRKTAAQGSVGRELHLAPAIHCCPQALGGLRMAREVVLGRSYFHLHLVSDATGETLIAASRAVAAQYQGVASDTRWR
jgi:hypothetical protein